MIISNKNEQSVLSEKQKTNSKYEEQQQQQQKESIRRTDDVQLQREYEIQINLQKKGYKEVPSE